MKIGSTTVLIAGLIIALAVFGLPFLAVSQGITVTSISTDVRVITESTNLKNVNYIIDTAFTGGGESLSGIISSADFAKLSGYSTERPFEIKVGTVDETFLYPIQNTGQGVHSYSVERVGPGDCVGADWIIKVQQNWLIYKPHIADICICKEQVASVGDIDNPTNQLSAKITLTSGDTSDTQTIDTITQQNVDFKVNDVWVAQANWYGNLITGDSPPNSALYVATYADVENKWRISHRNEYDSYLNNVDQAETQFTLWRDFPDDFDCGGEPCENIIQRTINIVNDKSNTLMYGSDATIGSAQTIVDETNLNAGKVSIQLGDRRVSNPAVRFLVSADWVGLNIPVGIPKIDSATCEEFSSGDDNGVIEISVTNIGQGEGTFVPSLLDSGIFEVSKVPTSKTFDKGETDTLLLYVSGGITAEPTDVTATVKVVDVHNSDNFDTASVTISMTEPKACVPGAERVSGSAVYLCNEDGMGESELLRCTGGEALERTLLGEWYCKEPTAGLFGGLSNLFDSLFGADASIFDKIINMILVVAGIVITVYLLSLILPVLIRNLLRRR